MSPPTRIYGLGPTPKSHRLRLASKKKFDYFTSFLRHGCQCDFEKKFYGWKNNRRNTICRKVFDGMKKEKRKRRPHKKELRWNEWHKMKSDEIVALMNTHAQTALSYFIHYYFQLKRWCRVALICTFYCWRYVFDLMSFFFLIQKKNISSLTFACSTNSPVDQERKIM